jgi:hypothetical protein
MNQAKKITNVIESARVSLIESGDSSHRWDGYTLTVTGDDEFIQKAFKDVKALKENLKKFVDQINITFPNGKIGENQKFTLKIQPTMGPVIMEPIKHAFDSSVEKYEY